MGKSLRVAYGEALVKLGQKNDKIVALDVETLHMQQCQLHLLRHFQIVSLTQELQSVI